MCDHRELLRVARLANFYDVHMYKNACILLSIINPFPHHCEELVTSK